MKVLEISIAYSCISMSQNGMLFAVGPNCAHLLAQLPHSWITGPVPEDIARQIYSISRAKLVAIAEECFAQNGECDMRCALKVFDEKIFIKSKSELRDALLHNALGMPGNMCAADLVPLCTQALALTTAEETTSCRLLTHALQG